MSIRLSRKRLGGFYLTLFLKWFAFRLLFISHLDNDAFFAGNLVFPKTYMLVQYGIALAKHALEQKKIILRKNQLSYTKNPHNGQLINTIYMADQSINPVADNVFFYQKTCL